MEIEIESVSSLIDRISSRRDRFFNPHHFFCFRGHRNADWELVPTMFRETPQSLKVKMKQVERDIYRDFRDMARPYVGARFDLQDPWEMLCFAQHYGVPTRLLDWTSNPLVALYFAVFDLDGKHDVEFDAALWCINVTKALDPKTPAGRSSMRGTRLADLPVDVPFFQGITRRASLHRSGSERQGKLYIIQSPDINDRIRTQAGLFSVYIPGSDGVDKWDHSTCDFTASSEEVLLKLIIPARYRMPMQRELERLGMLPDQIYPDLEGVGYFLKYWRIRRQEGTESGQAPFTAT